MRLSGDRDAHRVDTVENVRVIGKRLPAMFGGDFSGAPGPGVDDADEVDVLHRGEDPGVMLTEMTDADDRDPHTTRPTIVIPASSADARSASFSNISAFPASTDSALAPATRIA